MSVKVVNSGTGEKCTIDGKPVEEELKLKKIKNRFELIDELKNSDYDYDYTISFYFKNKKENEYIVYANNRYSGTFYLVRDGYKVSEKIYNGKYGPDILLVTKDYLIYAEESYQYFDGLYDIYNNFNEISISDYYIDPGTICNDYDNNIIYYVDKDNNESNLFIHKYDLKLNSMTKKNNRYGI